MENHNLIKGWEQALDYQFLIHNATLKNVYICSPLSADTEAGLITNMKKAREFMFYAHMAIGVYARAPHAYLPLLLSDNIPEERELGLEFGLKLLELSDTLYVCGERISNGMKGEILKAAELGLEIIVFNDDLLAEVINIISSGGGHIHNVRLDPNHPFMANNVIAGEV